MGDVVNLRTARKQKARGAREDEAARNRATFGMPKAERQLAEKRASMERDRLDAHRREGAETPPRSPNPSSPKPRSPKDGG
jgi:hypothetical protein